MSKFLYPIYKLKTKSYIKWWLYNKKAGGSGILSEILEGFSFNLANTLNRKFNLFEIEGNSTQDGEPSPDNEVPIYSAGDNENLFDDNENNNIWINQNGDKITTEVGSNCFKYNCSEGDTFTISAKFDVVNGSSIILIAFYDKNDNLLARNVALNNEKLTLTKTAPAQTSYMYAGHFINKPVEIKLEKGNKASGYSPYGMGSINEKISNKNLAYVEVEGKFRQYANGRFSTNASFNSYIAEVEESTQYTAVSLAGATNFSNLCQFDENMNFLEGNPFTGGSTKQFTTVTNCKYITIAVLNTIEDFMVVKGTTVPNLYVPHEEQDYSIFVQKPFRSNKDKTIKDKFVVKSDGKIYERHYIGEVVLNGTENIARELISNNFYKFYINNIENVDYGDVNYVPKILCNKLIAVTRTSMYLNTQGISSGNGNLQIYTDETKNMTVSEFKTWLENNNLIVNYLKTIPIDLPCTEEQIEALENLPSTYKDFTIIQSEDETPAHLKIQYYKEG